MGARRVGAFHAGVHGVVAEAGRAGLVTELPKELALPTADVEDHLAGEVEPGRERADQIGREALEGGGVMQVVSMVVS